MYMHTHTESEDTTKPVYEHTTAIKRGHDPIAHTLKVSWNEDFSIDISEETSIVEVEILMSDLSDFKESLGMTRQLIKSMPNTMVCMCVCLCV